MLIPRRPSVQRSTESSSSETPSDSDTAPIITRNRKKNQSSETDEDEVDTDVKPIVTMRTPSKMTDRRRSLQEFHTNQRPLLKQDIHTNQRPLSKRLSKVSIGERNVAVPIATEPVSLKKKKRYVSSDEEKPTFPSNDRLDKQETKVNDNKTIQVQVAAPVQVAVAVQVAVESSDDDAAEEMRRVRAKPKPVVKVVPVVRRSGNIKKKPVVVVSSTESESESEEVDS